MAFDFATVSIQFLVLTFVILQLYVGGFHFHRDAPAASRLYRGAINILGVVNTIICVNKLFLNPISIPSRIAHISGVCIITSQLLLAWVLYTTKRGRLALVFSDVKPTGVITSGPYALVRHPAYTSYTIGGTGITLALVGGCGMTLAISTVLICDIFILWLFGQAASMEEAQFEDAGDPVIVRNYAVYSRVVGARWIPGIW